MVYYGKLGYIKRNELFIFSFLLSLLIAATLKYHGFALSYIVVKLLKSVLIGSVLSLSAYIVVCLYGLKSAAKPFVFCAMITSVIAIFQSIGVDYAWSLRELLGYRGDGSVEIMIRDRLRIPGMSFYAITLSYQLLVALSLYGIAINYYQTGVNQCIRSYGLNGKEIFILAAISIGLFLSGSRSSYPVFILLFFVASHHINISATIKRIGVFAGVLLLVLVINDDLYSRFSSIGFGGAGRVHTNILALHMIFEYPFGIGTTSYSNIVSELFNKYDFDGYSLEQMQSMAPHNHLLLAAIYFGLAPVLLYIFYNFLLIIRLFSLPKDYRYVVIIAIVAYHVHTLFHNAGMLLNEQMGWYMFGIIEGILVLNIRNRRQTSPLKINRS